MFKYSKLAKFWDFRISKLFAFWIVHIVVQAYSRLVKISKTLEFSSSQVRKFSNKSQTFPLKFPNVRIFGCSKIFSVHPTFQNLKLSNIRISKFSNIEIFERTSRNRGHTLCIFFYIIHRKVERMRRSPHQYPWVWISRVYCVECYYRGTQSLRNTKTEMWILQSIVSRQTSSKKSNIYVRQSYGSCRKCNIRVKYS